MKKMLQLIVLFAVMLVPVMATAQTAQEVTIKDLNTYDNLTEYSEDAIESHPLAGELVKFTAVVVSYPKSSGLSTPSDTDDDGELDTISRIHVFVTDTSAIGSGRSGMSMQIVETDVALMEGFTRGDVIDVTGQLGYFNATAQFDVETVDLLGNVSSEYPAYADLLNPWVISSVGELNIANENGTYQINLDNYSKYVGSYVKIEGATVSNVSTGERPNWAANGDGSRIYIYDTSLRYRNDRVNGYLPSYNFRRLQGEDGLFEPPAPGSLINISGFLTMNGDDPDGNVAPNQNIFTINPFEDGVFYINGERYEDGDDLGGGVILDWPDDLEVVGQPPVFSNAMLSDSSVTSSDEVTVSVDVVAAEEGATIQTVNMVYIAGSDTTTVEMTGSGDTYSYTLPTFSNFTAVSFYFTATDSEALEGRDPNSGNYSFFVQDEAINSLALIQETSNGGPGASPLAGNADLPTEITGTIVSDASDGVIIVQDAAAAWSGVPLEQTSATSELSRGDMIQITSASVIEAEVNGGPSMTQLTDLEFELLSSGNDVDAVVPVITTDMVLQMQADGELEPYEGMLVKFEDVTVTERGIFGEYTIQNTTADSADGIAFNEDIRADDTIGSVGVSYDINHAIRLNKTMDAYAIVGASFGAPKFHPRNIDDFVTVDGNAFTPVLDFPLVSPADSAEVVVSNDLEVSWTATEDFDGDDLTYEWVLYSADTASVKATVTSDANGTEPKVTLPYETVDGLLADAGLAEGESATFLWNVRVSDGSDTLHVHGSYGNFGDDFSPLYRHITLERSALVANETEGGVPAEFTLKQNYPNPFNPTTQIAFDLPKASKVRLTVFDMLGRKVSTLVNERMSAGSQVVEFDASRLSSGMYIYRIDAGTFTSTKKMMLIK